MATLSPSGEPETWKSCVLYLPHALKVAEWQEADGRLGRAPVLLLKVGGYYWEQGWFNEVEKLELEVLGLPTVVH